MGFCVHCPVYRSMKYLLRRGVCIFTIYTVHAWYHCLATCILIELLHFMHAYVYLYVPVGSVRKCLSVHYQNDKMLSRLAMGTPQDYSQPVLRHEDEGVPHPYDGTVREVSALYSDIVMNEVQLWDRSSEACM